jgi:hypothetical protein
VTNLAAGTYFAFVGTDAFSDVPCGSRYRATLTTSTCVPPQPGDTIDPEPLCAAAYVDTTNGGCNFTPNVFGTVRCGEAIAGTYGTYLTSGGSNYRDTDWFAFTLTQSSSVSWSATGEARTRVFILGNGTGTCPASSLATAVADPGVPATASLPSLAPGTYFAFVGTDAFSGVPCGAQYRATLMTNPCCPRRAPARGPPRR